MAAEFCSGGGAEAALEEMLDALCVGAYQLWFESKTRSGYKIDLHVQSEFGFVGFSGF